ncbi:glycoside hydrolase [Trebonia kvetii]|uniref:Beta-xylanase n=2 Tax=Trebonia kvetii TaxID=2480626 RepID=A0A6P2C8J4_9ACTN|nr:glycoside hydrolase [Trebonia kvetii]
MGSAAQAALAPGTPLKTLAQAAGGRYFGSDMTADLLSNSTVTQLQAQQFNMVTPGNEMKWDTTEPSNGTFNFGPGDQIVNYATSNSERVRCHNLVWHSQLPSWVGSLPANQVQAAMETHITTEATHYKGKCYAWDVVNEPFNDDATATPRADVFFNAMGIGYIADALRTAHAADPNAKLYLNDYNIEGMNAKSNAMFSLAQSLLAQGVPLNGIGFESHFTLGGIPSDMQANMQRFANLGLDVAVTELDDRITLPATAANLQQQASDFTAVVKDCLGVTRCVGVTQWAVGDADSWIPGFFSGQGAATMFDQSYNPKPAFTAVQNTLAAAGGGGQNTVTVTNPGTRTGTVGTAASLQIQATDSASGQTLSYSATGLPAGLAINASTGLISGTPTTAANNTVTVTVKDTTGAAGTASFAWNISGSGGGGGGTCHVTYTKTAEWAGGFTAQVVIANTGTTAINGWSLTFTFPGDQKITSNFNGGFSQSGKNATLTNASYNGAIAPGANITDGFQGTWTSNDTNPASFSINGTACN